MLKLLVVAGILVALPALAQDTPDYRDDRSTPEALIESYYNAINRHEYSRAYTYLDQPAQSYDAFVTGYESTASVDVVIGTTTSEGGMSKTYTGVPVALHAYGTDGTESVFAGCYLTIQVEPTVLDPPYPGILIVSGTLEAAFGEPGTIIPDECPTGP